MQEDMVVAYLEGTAHVPDDFWALVLKYRQLRRWWTAAVVCMLAAWTTR